MTDITLGFEIPTGQPVTIEANNTFVAGMQGTGKSKAMQRLIEGVEGQVLIIDCKRKRDYADLNADIPLYIKQQMEPIVIKDSIETTERFTVKQQFGTLLDTVAESETWEDMLEFIGTEMKTERSGYIRNNLKILRYFLKRLVREHSRFQWSDRLELNDGISVLDISKMKIQIQQLVVGSVINYIQDNLTDITVIIDEAHRFIPQGQTSGCSRDLETFIREGRASRNWLYLADQTVTGISKDVLKQMQFWILGRQSELNEAERTVKQIPRARSLGVNIEAIQTLGLGEFLVVSYEWAKKTYIWPIWIDEATAIDVALGNRTAKSIARLEKKQPGDNEMVWKSKYDDLSKDYKKLEVDSKKREQEQTQTIKGLETRILDLDRRMKVLDAKTKKKDSGTSSASIAKPPELNEENPSVEEIEVPESIFVETTQPKLTIIIKQPPLTLDDEEVLGKVAILYAEGFFPKDKWWSNSLVSKGFHSHGWAVPRGGHIGDALRKLTNWGYLVSKKSGNRPDYQVKLNSEEAEEMGLLKTTVVH